MTPELIEAARRLAETLREENAALALLDLPRAAAMLGEKNAAADAFTDAGKRAVSAEIRVPEAAVRAVALRLRELAEENRRLLERAITVQGRVIGVVAGAARAQRPVSRYAARGQIVQDRQPAVALLARA